MSCSPSSLHATPPPQLVGKTSSGKSTQAALLSAKLGCTVRPLTLQPLSRSDLLTHYQPAGHHPRRPCSCGSGVGIRARAAAAGEVSAVAVDALPAAIAAARADATVQELEASGSALPDDVVAKLVAARAVQVCRPVLFSPKFLYF